MAVLSGATATPGNGRASGSREALQGEQDNMVPKPSSERHGRGGQSAHAVILGTSSACLLCRYQVLGQLCGYKDELGKQLQVQSVTGFLLPLQC